VAIALVENFSSLKTVSSDGQMNCELTLLQRFLGQPHVAGIVLDQQDFNRPKTTLLHNGEPLSSVKVSVNAILVTIIPKLPHNSIHRQKSLFL
jgi:hypothetical protein